MIGADIKNWKDWTDFIEHTLEGHIIDFGDAIQFRGQSDYDWNINSSFARIIKGDEKSESIAEFYEAQSKMEFNSQVHLLDPNMSYENVDSTSLLLDMQHYSCPTRLVDWTLSPYVALYFCVSENLQTDGAFYAFDFKNYNHNLKTNYPDFIMPKNQEFLDFKEFDLISVIYPTKKNHRIVRQQGCFHYSNNILRNHDDIIESEPNGKENFSGLFKLKIPSELKIEFIARLRTMNITAESLFPGLDGLGKSLRDMMLVRKWRKR